MEIRVDDVRPGQIDSSNVDLSRTEAYALWPARETRKGDPIAPRRLPGTRFKLTIVAPENREAEVRNVVRAWLLFGGYGSRTRRGLGSLAVVTDRGKWLPSGASREAFTRLFGDDVFAGKEQPPKDVPILAGSALYVGESSDDAQRAWSDALGWLREFRQGTNGQPNMRAREPGTGKIQPNRPSISNWPEADKIRRLSGKTKAHVPRSEYGGEPAWPRAGFGLPIVGRFQPKGRDNRPLDEPGQFELQWRDGPELHDRLASPLIVKALALSDGRFLPCALWLNRAYPVGKDVLVVLKGVRGSEAPFDRMLGAGDRALFSPILGKASIRDAFLDWLRDVRRVSEVAR